MEWLSVILIATAIGESASFNFTFAMAAHCKEHVSRRGYVYDTFYRVNRETRKFPPGVDFEMHLAILASSNGHILLSPKPIPKLGDPVYEIVVGGGSNRFSEIRRNQRTNAKTSFETVGILSSIEFRAFRIRIRDGFVEFGRENETLPLLVYYDNNPLQINYFSFSSWTGVEAKFLYDCAPPKDDKHYENETSSEEPPDSKMVEPTLTSAERLRLMLLTDRSSYMPPDPEITVEMALKVTSVAYNAFESKLYTGLAITLKWIDETLAWNPSKFNDTTNLIFRQGEIWKPSFLVYNADNLGALDSNNPEPIYVVNSGWASLHFQSIVTTWCDDRSNSYSKWPRDSYNCAIVIGPWGLHEKINMILTFSNINSKILSNFYDEVIENEWELVSTEQNIIKNIRTAVEMETSNDNVQITLRIRRKALPYNIVFYSPLLVLVTFLLLSFWSKRLVMSRVWFYAGCIVVMCMGLSFIDILVPTHTIPSIIILYACVLMGTLIALVVQVVLMHPSMATVYKSQAIESVLSCGVLRLLLRLPRRTLNKSSVAYENVNEPQIIKDGEDSGISTFPRNNLEQMQSDTDAISEKEEIAEVIDKLMFFLYSIVFGMLLTLHY